MDCVLSIAREYPKLKSMSHASSWILVQVGGARIRIKENQSLDNIRNLVDIPVSLLASQHYFLTVPPVKTAVRYLDSRRRDEFTNDYSQRRAACIFLQQRPGAF